MPFNSGRPASCNAPSAAYVMAPRGAQTVSGGQKIKSMVRNAMRSGSTVVVTQSGYAVRKPPPPLPKVPNRVAGHPSCVNLNGYVSCKWQANYGQMGRLS
jgi:hypothetical protein